MTTMFGEILGLPWKLWELLVVLAPPSRPLFSFSFLAGQFFGNSQPAPSLWVSSRHLWAAALYNLLPHKTRWARGLWLRCPPWQWKCQLPSNMTANLCGWRWSAKRVGWGVGGCLPEGWTTHKVDFATSPWAFHLSKSFLHKGAVPCQDSYQTTMMKPRPPLFSRVCLYNGFWTPFSAHLCLLPPLLQLMCAQRSLSSWDIPLCFFQPLPQRSNQFSEYIQLFLTRRSSFFPGNGLKKGGRAVTTCT